MRYDYKGHDKRYLIDLDNPKARGVFLVLPWTIEDMGKLGILVGEAKKDYEGGA